MARLICDVVILPVMLVAFYSAHGCSDESSSDEPCADVTVSRDTPEIRLGSLYPGVFDSQSTFSIAQAERATEIEIRLGDLAIWRSLVPVGMTEFALDDGEFLAGQQGLATWQRYAVVARAHDGMCVRSDWSEPVDIVTDDGSEELFARSSPLRVSVTLSEESYEAIAAEAKPPGTSYPYTRSYYSGDVALDGNAFVGAGVRVKGSGSARLLTEKAALKVHLGWHDPDVPGCAKERRFYGLKRITLNNMVQDESYVRETLGYELYSALRIPVPRTQYATVELNSEHYGLYLHVESVDRRFLARRFVSARGSLYEAVYGGGRDCDISPEKLLVQGDDNCFSVSFQVDECSNAQPGDDPDDHSELHRLGERISAIPPGRLYDELSTFFDMDEYLAVVSAEIVAGAGDSHVYHHNNYRIYHEPSEDLWHMIPTGIDTLFSEWLPPDTLAAEPVAYLVRRCLAEHDCRDKLLATIENTLDVFESLDFETRLDDLAESLESEVANDAKGEAPLGEVLGSREQLRRFVTTRRDAIESLLEQWRQN